MALKRPDWSAGRVVVLEHSSSILKDNPLGDPHERLVHAWLPPQYDREDRRHRGRRFPVLYDLVGYTGTGRSHTDWRNFSENVPERCARLVSERRMSPSIVVFPDCFTALGGNQYVNSSAIGNYAEYLVREIVPFVDAQLRTLAAREHRGAFGKSSGGYGAMIHGMLYPQVWGAIGNHSGDANFDFVYRSDWPKTLNTLARYSPGKRRGGSIDVRRLEAQCAEGRDDGRVAAFLEYVWREPSLSSDDVHCLMNICMAATYDPDPEAPNGFLLPFNLETGELLRSRWRQWRKHDPINMVARYAEKLKSLKGIYIDCGWRDQYHIHYGTRILSKRLAERGVPHVYEEFDGTHSGVDHRMDRSLPFLSRMLRG